MLLPPGDEGLPARAGVVAVEGRQVEAGRGQAEGVRVGGRGRGVGGGDGETPVLCKACLLAGGCFLFHGGGGRKEWVMAYGEVGGEGLVGGEGEMFFFQVG